MATSTHGDAPDRTPATLVHLITRLSLGGSATNTIDSAAAAARAGYRTVLATGPDDGEPGTNALAPDASFRVETIPALTREPSPFRDLKALFQIFCLLRDEKPDIVHTHTSKAGFLGRLAAFAAGVPVVIHTAHGHIFNGYYGRAATAGFVWLERLAARLTDRLVFLTEAEARDHRKLRIGNVDGYTTIPSGVDLEALRRRAPERTVARHQLGWPGRAKVVLGVGRLVPVKGFDLLLRALPTIRRECPEARLVLVGEGPERSKLEALVDELTIGEWVEMAGAREDVSPYLAAADVLVAPSRNEGQGRTLVEAMVLGLPVVGANVGGIPDVLDEGTCGALVPPEDPEAIARAVLSIFRDEELHVRYRKHGVTQAELFSLPVMEAKLLALYRELAAARKLRPSTSPALVESGKGLPRVASDSILVWNVSGIGDFADSLPALAELRRRRPRAHIVVAVAEKTVPLAKLCRHVDEVAGFPTRPGRGAPPLTGCLRWVSTIFPWRKRFGIVVELYGVSPGAGLVFTRWLLRWVGAPLTIGRRPGASKPVFDRELPSSETPTDLMGSYSKLVSLVPPDRPRFDLDDDGPAIVIPPEILVEVDDWLDAQRQFEGMSGPLVVVALGGDRPSRREFPERAERWLTLLQREHAIRPVLWGTRQDPGIPSTSSLVYADGRGLGGLVYSAALVSRADAVITTQTSAQHLVSVWDVPTVVLVGPADPEKHRPHLSESPLRLVQRKVPCAPCSYHECPWKGDEYKKCVRGIEPGEVARAFRELGVTKSAHARS